MAKTKWLLDPVRSRLQFKAKNVMVIDVTGYFEKIEGTAETVNEDFSTAEITCKAFINSINTASEQRDKRLKSDEFFDAEKFPVLLFKSTNIEKGSGNHFVLNGNVTIKNITKPIKLNVEFEGIQNDKKGNLMAGFLLSGTINRKDYGLNWNAALETGGLLLSEDIVIESEIQMIKET